MDLIASLPTNQGRPEADRYTAQQKQEVAGRVEEASPAFKTVAAECRKTT